MKHQTIEVSHEDGISTISFNRPEKRNAMNGPMVMELLAAVTMLANDEDTKVLILRGNGENFCAGGDIGWMQKIATGSDEENADDAQLLADFLYQLYQFPKPTIALAHGTSLGGGLGVFAAADIAIAAKDAVFGLPEVKIGITPSIISPYVVTAIGERAAHYYFLTGERFSATEALRIGLAHELVERNALNERGYALAKIILDSSPAALQVAKHLIRHVASEVKITDVLAQKTAEHLANIRSTKEAQEGLKAYLEKRKPQW